MPVAGTFGQMTPEQREAAKETARVTNETRRNIVNDFKNEAITLREIGKLVANEDKAVIGKLKLKRVLLAKKGWGATKIENICSELNVDLGRNLKFLSGSSKARQATWNALCDTVDGESS